MKKISIKNAKSNNIIYYISFDNFKYNPLILIGG